MRFFITLPSFGRVELLFCVRKNSDDEKQHCSYCMSESTLYLGHLFHYTANSTKSWAVKILKNMVKGYTVA